MERETINITKERIQIAELEKGETLVLKSFDGDIWKIKAKK
jgi:hypothetical protein